MKAFVEFSLKRKLIADEKELETLFKDLNGDAALAEQPFLKKREFTRLFYRSCFKASLQNIAEYIDKSNILMRC